MEIKLKFGRDWQGLPHELKCWRLPEDQAVSPACECANGSKRRRLNPDDPVEEEAWLQWLDSSESDDQLDPFEDLKHATSCKETYQNDETELNDAEKSILNNLMKYLLDPPEAEEDPDTGRSVICGEHRTFTSEGSSSPREFMQNRLEAEVMAGEEMTGVSTSNTTGSKHGSLASSASSIALWTDDPKTPETRSEGLPLEEENEEVISDKDSDDEFAISDPDPEKAKAHASSLEDQTKWEELQISQSSHPSTPSSSEEAEPLHRFHPHSQEEYNTLSLLHLLTACAEAAACGSKDLATIILARIKNIVSPNQNTFQRIAYYYYQTLHSLVKQELPLDIPAQTPEAIAGAFQLLHEVCPYNRFAHMTANQAILESIEGKSGPLHIVDLDIMEGLQWPPLMAALAERSDQVSSLRITALELDQAPNTLSSSLELTGRRLSDYAEALHMPFSFEITTLNEENGSLNLPVGSADELEGETLLANCMLKLPHMTPRNPKTITAFLSALKKLSIHSVILSDDALKCRPVAHFTEAFFDILHHSCALFDSVEASLSIHNLAMAVVETTYLAPRICSTVVSICHQDKEQEKEELGSGNSVIRGDMYDPNQLNLEPSPLTNEDWWKFYSRSSYIMQDLGFEPTCISHYNQIQAQLLLAFYKEGYRIKDHEGHGLAICWEDTPLLAVSIWKHSQGTDTL